MVLLSKWFLTTVTGLGDILVFRGTGDTSKSWAIPVKKGVKICKISFMKVERQARNHITALKMDQGKTRKTTNERTQ